MAGLTTITVEKVAISLRHFRGFRLRRGVVPRRASGDPSGNSCHAPNELRTLVASHNVQHRSMGHAESRSTPKIVRDTHCVDYLS